MLIGDIVKVLKNIKFQTIAALLLFIINIQLITFFADIEPTKEFWARKIFYLHVPIAWSAFLGSFLVMVYSVLYLVTKKNKWDRIGVSSAETTLLFTLLILITGPIWAAPVWGQPWSWEPRLITTLILFLIYLGYFMVRGYTESYELSARLSSVIGIIAFLDIPIIYKSVTFWSPDSQAHPQTDNLGYGDINIFLFSLLSFTILLVNMISVRASVMKGN